jgi:hypothetical protein
MARTYTITRSGELGWIVVLAIAAAAMALHPSNEADLFFHLELGRSVIAHAARTVPEPFAFVGFAPDCMVPAWLWDVLAYTLYGLGGITLLSVCSLACAAAAGLAIAAFTRRWSIADPRASGGWLWVSALCLVCAGQRFELRPQTLALALLAGYLALVHAHTGRTGRRRQQSGLALVGLALLWAQLHGSFVLAPLLVTIVLGSAQLRAAMRPDVLREAQLSIWPSEAALPARAGAARDRGTDLAVLFGCTLALATSAAGLDVISYIGGHGYGDAVKFIYEMRPPTWAGLLSMPGTSGFALPLLWLLGLFGVSREGRVQWTPLALALCGHWVLSRAWRFVAEDALLCAPLALSGAHNLGLWLEGVTSRSVRRAFAPLATLGLCALLALSALERRGGYGGRFGLGLEISAFPQLSAAYLDRHLARDAQVLTAFSAGPPLGFWSGGKLRTYVDGRTPLYFDDADYAVSRDVFTDDAALGRALTRWSIQAAVVERAHGVCDLLAKRWQAVVIEARYSTFVPPGRGSALAGVDPCGPEFIHPRAIDASAIERTLGELARLGANPFIDYLRAQQALAKTPADPGRALALLERSAEPSYARPHRRLRVDALLQAGQLDPAVELLREALADGDVSVLRFVAAPQMGALPLSSARELLEAGIELLGEAASPTTRSMLAAVCVEQGDAECARYHALRAAVRGASNIEPTLSWLGDHARTARMRADARAWLELLRRETSITRGSEQRHE